jgi:hypothetical protein
VIKRVFGILKRRFRILRYYAEYLIKTQIQLIYALTAIYNFIARNASKDALKVSINIEKIDKLTNTLLEPLRLRDYIK